MTQEAVRHQCAWSLATGAAYALGFLLAVFAVLWGGGVLVRKIYLQGRGWHHFIAYVMWRRGLLDEPRLNTEEDRVRATPGEERKP